MVNSIAKAPLAQAFREVWSDQQRLKTLSRIIVQERQFEAWWKFELATHLWEFSEQAGVYVWVEGKLGDSSRADIVLAHAKSANKSRIDASSVPCIPMELKTVGTFWKDPAKAYKEEGRKRLLEDLRDARVRADTGLATPFAVVALLVTHVGSVGDKLVPSFLDLPRSLAKESGLATVLDEQIDFSMYQQAGTVVAHQFVWMAKAS